MKKKLPAILVGAVVLLLLAYVFLYQGVWVWIMENTDVPPDKMVILVAKTDKAHRGLAEQFSERSLHKEYLALVSGAPALISGSIRKAIGRNKQHRHKMSVIESEE
ncbi:MAG: pseudouridine synthase, partial [Verrucomicrobiota bacterium]